MLDERPPERPVANQRKTPERPTPGDHLMARSFYKELRENGYSLKELLAASTELIDLVSRDLAKDH
jgi:hypothetical protein